MERFLAEQFVPKSISHGLFGQFQFAYSPGRGARDALLWLVLFCLTSFAAGRRIGLYKSDASGAFDRVSKERLLCKLASAPIPR
eukprot:8036442-Pyramimonas_sp.AAC.1